MFLEVYLDEVVGVFQYIFVSKEAVEKLLQSCTSLVHEFSALGPKCLLGGEARQTIEGSEVELLLHAGLEAAHARVSVLDAEDVIAGSYDLDLVFDVAIG